jgi:hypothetical protein
MYLKIIKATYDKPIANLIVSGEKTETISLNSGMKKGAHSPHSYSTCMMLTCIVCSFTQAALEPAIREKWQGIGSFSMG